MKKKGQVALEFLASYGWAILAVLVVIGALIYFQTLTPSRLFPAKCIMTAGMSCNDYQIKETYFVIIATNKMGESIRNVRFSGNPRSDDFIGSGLTAGECTITPAVINAEEQFTINCTTTSLTPEVFQGLKNSVKIEFELNYTLNRKTYEQTSFVSLYAPIDR